MRRIFLLSLLFICSSGVRAADGPLTVLFITGADRSHSWKQQTEETGVILGEAAGRFAPTVQNGYAILDRPADMAAYDAILLTGSFWDTPDRGNPKAEVFTLSDAQATNLVDYVKAGHGFYAQHLGNASWQGNAAFSDLCGRRWKGGSSGHPARRPFETRIADPAHPITAGITPFTTDDECYTGLGIYREVGILVTGLSESSKKDEPLLMASAYGAGRVVVCTFGHDRKALQVPQVRTVIRRSVEWVATGAVSIAK